MNLANKRFITLAAGALVLAGLAHAADIRTASKKISVSPSAAGAKPTPRPTPNVSPKGNPTPTFYLTVLHHNDGESQLINAGPGALADFGGIARFKTLLDNLKAQAAVYPAAPVEKGAVFISSGDNFLAGPEFNASLELPAGQPYYDSVGMSLLGYSACVIGNHEFDFGPAVFGAFVAGFNPATKFLSANLDFTNEPGLLALQNQGRLAKSTIVQVGSQQIGIVGATTTDLPFVSSPGAVIVNALLPAIQAEVDNLYFNLGVNKIILASHLQGLSSEAALIPMLRRVDIVIGGGGGELLADPGALLVPGDTAFSTNIGGTGYPRVLTDADGRSVPLVTTRGDYRYIGRLIVGFDANGDVLTYDDALDGPQRVSGIAPDAVAANPVIQQLVVDPVAAAVATLGQNIIAQSQVGLDGRNSTIRAVETNLGNLCADAMLYNCYVNAAANGAPLPDVALQNGGGIRNNNILPAGNFTELNTFEVLPFSNFLCVVPSVPPQRFKQVLENAVSRVNQSSNGRFAQIAGFSFVWDATGTAQVINSAGQITTPGTRIREVVLNDGRVIVRNGQIVPGAPSINVATLSFLANGGDQYPLGGLPYINIPGISYQQSLERYVVDYLGGQITSIEYPEGGEGRIIRLN